jgi:hypothetical protein
MFYPLDSNAVCNTSHEDGGGIFFRNVGVYLRELVENLKERARLGDVR